MNSKYIAAGLTIFILLSCLSGPRPTESVEPTVTLLSTPPFNAEPATQTAFPTSTKTPVSMRSLTPEQSETSQITGIATLFLGDEILGIPVHYYYDPDRFFPESWRREPINCTARQFDFVEAPRVYLAILDFSLAYDLTFVQQNLTDIYVLNDLECYGKSYGGGTTGSSSLYLEVDSQQNGYSDQFLRSMLHNQFSEILIDNYPFPDQEWRSVNADGFRYSENVLEVVEQESIRQQTRELLEAGFLAAFATTSVANDFGLFAEWLFTQETALCELRKRYERINEKAYLAIEFYKAIGSEAVFLECKQLASANLEKLR